MIPWSQVWMSEVVFAGEKSSLIFSKWIEISIPRQVGDGFCWYSSHILIIHFWMSLYLRLWVKMPVYTFFRLFVFSLVVIAIRDQLVAGPAHSQFFLLFLSQSWAHSLLSSHLTPLTPWCLKNLSQESWFNSASRQEKKVSALALGSEKSGSFKHPAPYP